MAALFSFGILLIISIAVMILATIIGLFTDNIILFESIGIAIAAGCLSGHFFQIHPAFCILIGIAVMAGLYFLMNTKFGFWIIGGVMSVAWGFCAATFAFMISEKDMIWAYVTWGLATIAILALHIRAKNNA